jgi:uncharacterized protein YijF (DUF1287 family)
LVPVRKIMSALRSFFLVALFCSHAVAAVSPQQVVQGARRQIGVTIQYDSAYARLAYPGGDVPLDRGVCSDVVVRALRYAGIDLQVLVHEDMQSAWHAYPHNWGLKAPDANIDHRRVPNLEVFFRRHGASLPVSQRAADYLPGDIVSWKLANGLPHIGIVSGTRWDTPLVIHNIGAGAQEESVLFDYQIVGHFRWTAGTGPSR